MAARMPEDSADRASGPTASWAVMFFLILTVVCTWPVARDMRDHVQDRGDPLLQVVLLAWASDAAVTPGATWANGPQFYPYRNTGAYQNSFLGQVPLFAPVYWLTGNPVLAFEATLLAALFLSGLCMWGYVRHITASSFAGLSAGLVFAFHQYRFRNLQHLQVMSIWWWPLALWALEDFLATRRWRSALALGAAGVAQLYCSIYMGLFLIFLIAIRCAVEVLAEPTRLADRMLLRRGFLTLIYGGACLLPLLWPYVRVMQQLPPAHALSAIVQFSAAPGDYLRGGLSSVPYYWVRARQPWRYTFEQHVLFPGVVTSVLAVYGWAATEAVARRAAGIGRFARRRAFALVVAAAVGVVLSLGPYLKHHGLASDIPLPALALLQHVPGYGIFRVNTRFAFLLLFAASIGVGQAYAVLVARRPLSPAGRMRLFAAGAALLLAENWNAPVPTQRVAVGADIPPVYAALADEDPDHGAILEVPFRRDLYEDITRIYYGLRHGRPTVNGYGTVEPPGYGQFAALARGGPTPALFAALAAWDVRTVVVHYGAMTPEAAAAWRAGRTQPDVRVWRTFDDTDVWKIETPPAPVDHPSAGLVVPTARAGGETTATLSLSTPAGRVWRCPRPLGLRDTTVTWQPTGTGPLVEEQVRVLVPLFVAWTQPMDTTVTLRVPGHPGVYMLRVDCGVAVAETRVQVLPPPPA